MALKTEMGRQDTNAGWMKSGGWLLLAVQIQQIAYQSWVQVKAGVSQISHRKPPFSTWMLEWQWLLPSLTMWPSTPSFNPYSMPGLPIPTLWPTSNLQSSSLSAMMQRFFRASIGAWMRETFCSSWSPQVWKWRPVELLVWPRTSFSATRTLRRCWFSW